MTNLGLPVLPVTLGLFEKRFDGDDRLMELARLRFQQAEMGTEIYAVTPEVLEWTMRFRPEGRLPVVAHLSRGMKLTDPGSHHQIENFARRFAGQVLGFVIHDERDLAHHPRLYQQAAETLNAQLRRVENCPRVFIEYAAGLELEPFMNFFESIRELDHISACVDIGHVGIQQTRKAYSKIHPGQDVCQLKLQPMQIPQAMPDLEQALATALPVVLNLIETLGKLGKPVHFHLHDGHPLSTFSPFGVSDHLSFLTEVPLNFEHHGQRHTGLMFGPAGLNQIAGQALQAFSGQPLSFTLEIHPIGNCLPLDDAAELFKAWRDKTNAEKMNHWLSVLQKNHQLLHDGIRTAAKPIAPPKNTAPLQRQSARCHSI